MMTTMMMILMKMTGTCRGCTKRAGVQGRLSSFYVTFSDNFPTSAQMEAARNKELESISIMMRPA